MMGVVKKKAIAAALCPMTANAPNEFRIIPFMHENEIGAIESLVEIERREFVKLTFEPRISSRESVQRSLAMFGAQVAQTPALLWLVDFDFMAALDQLGRDTAKKMGVTVIPIGEERVIEKDDLHAARSPE